jgi:fructose-1,6-bisphosphatase/sedoheptulose 1,7-bisphosphatase-like protein
MSFKPIGNPLERALSLEIARVTERAAVAAARLRGRGAEKMSDQAAVDAMRRELSGLAPGSPTAALLRGVQFGKDLIETETLVMRSTTGTVRWIRAEHRHLDKCR